MVEVQETGAIKLGAVVSCDGFIDGCDIRVQSHIHLDHMDSFEKSKGEQDILGSEATVDLLCARFDADLPIRENLIRLPFGRQHKTESCSVTLLPSGHMLGSAQVCVTANDGQRFGYSGDFNWPLDEVIRVDILVVDSTYGDPSRVRQFTQEEVEEAFLGVVHQRKGFGPIHILAHRGTMEIVLQLLSGEVDLPFIGHARLASEVEVYRSNGYSIRSILGVRTDEGKQALRSNSYIRFYRMGEGFPREPEYGTTISLSDYLSRHLSPVTKYADRAYNIVFSNHADFNGTLDYIRTTKAKLVITDASRTPAAARLLAEETVARLGIKAMPSTQLA